MPEGTVDPFQLLSKWHVRILKFCV